MDHLISWVGPYCSLLLQILAKVNIGEVHTTGVRIVADWV